MSDVCLILESTYPYVAGGVSSWVYDIIKNINDISFSLIYLGAYSSQTHTLNYPVPSNVVELKEFFLFDYTPNKKKTRGFSDEEHQIFFQFIESIFDETPVKLEELINILRDNKKGFRSIYNLLYSKKSWNFMINFYNKNFHDYPFNKFVWSWHMIFIKFLSILRIQIPVSEVYHSVATGYAGLIGVIAKIIYKKPFILTEHGIYTRERKIDILNSSWIYSIFNKKVTVSNREDGIKEMWIKFFVFLSNISYSHADEIISICESNRKIQLQEGAENRKTSVITNSVKMPAEHKKYKTEKFNICFVGRIVPIKNIKTFIRASAIINKTLAKDTFEINILGPYDEDKEYFKECEKLVALENLNNIISFKGKVNLKDYYPKIDVLVLTSISEGQPLVILEAQAYGIPVVSTDVGDCKALLEGGNKEDKAIGRSGIITEINNEYDTAKSIIKLYNNKNLYAEFSRNAIKRVKEYYLKHNMIASYRHVYQNAITEVN
ncbi:MAG: DUF3492 domain-containing protein [Bacteroidetes bacterium]|nr:DUF3492 domain-containing protein [Bacteroidota bacterium]